MARKAITKKIRFEVFKRDSFTCQYCGSVAPSVVLNIDHINPVANGGSNEILNLITSCFECNSGKSDRLLSDDAVLTKQLNQAKVIAEKREQLEMMAEWHKGLKSIAELELDMLEDQLDGYGFTLSEFGKNEFRKTIKQYGLADVMEATDKSANQYLHDRKDEAQRKKFLDYIPKICYWQKRERTNPVEANLRKIAYTANRMWTRCYPNELTRRLFQLNFEHKIEPDDLLKIVYASSGIMKFEENVTRFLEARDV